MKKGLLILSLAVMTALPVAKATAVVKPQEAMKESEKTVKVLDWGELMPEPDQTVVDDYREGKMDWEAVQSYLDKLGNSAVDKLDNTYGRMPGYLVPLNLDENQKATELLLVPTMGACIHVPPPPPNQTIYIKFDEGISVTEAGYTPYWVTGTLIVEKNTSEYTDTLYSIQVESIEEYL